MEHSRRLCTDTEDLVRERPRLVADDCNNMIRQEISKMIQTCLKKENLEAET